MGLRLSRRGIGALYALATAFTAALAVVLVAEIARTPSPRTRDWVALTALTGLVACAIVGLATAAFRHSPKEIARRYVHRLPAKWRAPFETIEPDFYDIDAEALIRIGDAAEAEAVRARLVSYIFKDDSLPTGTLPAAVDDARNDPWIADLRRVASAERLTINMDHGVTSFAFLLRPVSEKGVLVVQHEGHNLDPSPGFRSIQAFLDEGFPVLALWMPLLGPNPAPVADVPGVGRWRLRGHDHFCFLESESFSPLKFFVEPVVVALNHAEASGYRRFAMVGVSGGAWSTTVAAAVDPRIARSYPVGGGVPLAYWNEPDGNFGDYEAHHPQLLRIADYIDMYVLGAFGEGRRQLLIMNKYDPTCFYGSHALLYGGTVRKRVARLGAGSFDLLLDDTHADHALSAHARALVERELDDFARAPARRFDSGTFDTVPTPHGDVVI